MAQAGRGSGRGATLRDVAAHAGVHPATAGRALNPETRRMVNPVTLERVLASAGALNYRTNAAARTLRTQRTDTVGVIIPDITNPLFPPIVRGLAAALEDGGYATLVVYTGGQDERLGPCLDVLRRRGVDGLIVATARRRDRVLGAAVQEGVPIVQINRRSETRGIASVTVDDAGGIASAVAHLRELGHTRIGHLGAPQMHSTGRARLAGFRAAMRDAQLPLDPSATPIAREVSITHGRLMAEQLLRRRPDLTAIVAANDLLALGCYDAIGAVGRTCPQDVSVIGFNDMAFADRFRPPLTTVHFDHQEMGDAAGRLLLRQMHSEATSASRVELSTRLIERGSTAPPASGRSA